jgi:hypothetical protein
MEWSNPGFIKTTTSSLILDDQAMVGCVRGSTGDTMRSSYFDFDIYARDPGQVNRVVELFTQAIEKLDFVKEINLLAFIKKNDIDDSKTIGLLPLAAAISTDERVWLPYITVRLGRIGYDKIKINRNIEYSNALRGKHVLVLTDHVTKGAELEEAVRAVTDSGGKSRRSDNFYHLAR